MSVIRREEHVTPLEERPDVNPFSLLAGLMQHANAHPLMTSVSCAVFTRKVMIPFEIDSHDEQFAEQIAQSVGNRVVTDFDLCLTSNAMGVPFPMAVGFHLAANGNVHGLAEGLGVTVGVGDVVLMMPVYQEAERLARLFWGDHWEFTCTCPPGAHDHDHD